MAPVAPRYLTTEDVAELCRTAPSTVRYWRSSNQGPRSFKLGRRVLYDPDDVASWIETSRAASEVEGVG